MTFESVKPCQLKLCVNTGRAYRVYNVVNLDYEAGDDGEPHIITWRFKLGLPSSEPMTPRIDSSR